MRLQASDYFLVRFCQRSKRLLRWIADRETSWLASELASVKIDRPVFVTGLARSGTTLLLELLASVEGVATHRYRDFPLLFTPYFWNRYLDRLAIQQEPVERPHQDGIRITRESPEGMEEPLWHAFFPHVHSVTSSHRLVESESHPAFERFYLDHLRKLLLIRQGNRYFAKGNYHIPRIEYLARVLPDSRFIIPVRHPLTHIPSLMRQHELFSEYASADPRVPRYLEAAGHFEFGPQRVPIRLDPTQGDRILEAWSRDDSCLGYSIQWAEIYRFAESLRSTNKELAPRILIVRHEDLCREPAATIRQILEFAELEPQKATPLFAQLNRIRTIRTALGMPPALRVLIAAEVACVAEAYGYRLGTSDR